MSIEGRGRFPLITSTFFFRNRRFNGVTIFSARGNYRNPGSDLYAINNNFFFGTPPIESFVGDTATGAVLAHWRSCEVIEN